MRWLKQTVSSPKAAVISMAFLCLAIHDLALSVSDERSSDYWAQVLTLKQDLGNQSDEAVKLNHLGVGYYTSGDKHKGN
jgi:hypothetical protein